MTSAAIEAMKALDRSAPVEIDEQPKMQYVRLGKSGLKISKVILGAMGYGDKSMLPWALEQEEALPLLEYAYKRGINTWDTADLYSQGKSEETIGNAIRKFNIPREELVILPKCYFGLDPKISESGEANMQMAMFNDGHMVNRVGLSRKHILAAVDASVARLGTYIDVYQIHRYDRDVPAEEIMKALNDVVESGKVRYIGASSMAAWEFQMLNNVAEKHGWHKFISMQNYHNLAYREEEREMIPYCNHAGIGLIPWSPLAQGVLARPWTDENSTTRSKDRFVAMFRNPEFKPVIDRLEEVANRLGKSMAMVAIAWSLKKGVNPILGLQSIHRIDEALETINFELSDEDVKLLEEPYKAKDVAPVY